MSWLVGGLSVCLTNSRQGECLRNPFENCTYFTVPLNGTTIGAENCALQLHTFTQYSQHPVNK